MTEAYKEIDKVRAFLSPEKLATLERRALNDAAKKVKTIVKKEVSGDYAVPQSWIAEAVMAYTVTGNKTETTVTIPVKNKHAVYGPRLKLYKKAKKVKRFKGKLLRSTISTLPERFKDQGNRPGFAINVNGKSLLLTRHPNYNGKKTSIVRVTGLAAGQMAANKSSQDIERQVVDYTIDRIQHHFNYLFNH